MEVWLYTGWPVFTLSNRGYENSLLQIMFSANYIDQSNVTSCKWRYLGSFDHLICLNYMPEVTQNHNNKTIFVFWKKYCAIFWMHYLISWNPETICKYKFHTKSTWTWSVMGSYQMTLSDSVNRGLTLYRLTFRQKVVLFQAAKDI